MKAIVAERGQVTIPKILRQKLGIRPGTILELDINGSTLVAVKADEKDPIEKVFGCLGKLNTNKIMLELRGKDK